MTGPVILDILEMAKNIFSLLQSIGSISRTKGNKIEKRRKQIYDNEMKKINIAR